MKTLIILLINLFLVIFNCIAGNGYYYYGQYFLLRDDQTATLIAPQPGNNQTLSKEYKGDFSVWDWFPVNSVAYKVTGIGESAFERSKITSLSLGEFVDSIGFRSCASCKQLSSVSLNGNLHSIGGYAFENCSVLKEITFPNSLIFIGDNAFARSGIQDTLIIPGSVENIGIGAFFGTDIATVKFSSPEINFGEYAFAQIDKFNTVDVYSLEDWCNYKFTSEYANPLYYAKNLTLNGTTITDLDLTSDNITCVPVSAFCGLKDIKTVKLGQNITQISSKALYTSSIDSIFINNIHPPVIEENTFSHLTYSRATLVVPLGSLDDYMNAPNWRLFSNIIEVNVINTRNTSIYNPVFTVIGRELHSNDVIPLCIYDVSGNLIFNNRTNRFIFPCPGCYFINEDKVWIK